MHDEPSMRRSKFLCISSRYSIINIWEANENVATPYYNVLNFPNWFNLKSGWNLLYFQDLILFIGFDSRSQKEDDILPDNNK